MDNLIKNIDNKIKKFEYLQNISIEIVRCISVMNIERQHYDILRHHMDLIKEYDNKIEKCHHEKIIHDEFIDDWNKYQELLRS